LSVEAFQARETLVEVLEGELRPVGTLGAVVSVPPVPQVPSSLHQPQDGQ
jgi:hypothetical protein